MPYAQVSDVRALAPHVPISNNSQPSEGIVNEWIRDVEATVDATLKGIGYKVPVTGPSALKVVRQIVANGVMAMVMRSRPNPETDPENFQKRFDGPLKALRDPKDPFELPDDAERVDAPLKGERTYRFASSFRDTALDDEAGDRFTRTTRF